MKWLKYGFFLTAIISSVAFAADKQIEKFLGLAEKDLVNLPGVTLEQSSEDLKFYQGKNIVLNGDEFSSAFLVSESRVISMSMNYVGDNPVSEVYQSILEKLVAKFGEPTEQRNLDTKRVKLLKASWEVSGVEWSIYSRDKKNGSRASLVLSVGTSEQ